MKRQKLVVVLSTIFVVRGGIPRFNQMLCLALDRLAEKLDLDIWIVSQDDGQADYEKHGSPWKNLKFVPGDGKYNLTWRTLKLAAAERPDWMLIGLLGMTPVGWICQPFIKRGYGFIAHGYECWDELPLARPTRSRRFTSKGSSFVLSVSAFTADALHRSVGIPRERILIQPNTLAPEFQALPDGTVPSDKAGLEILTVSRLWVEDPMKGVDHTIEVMPQVLKRFPDAKFRVVGSGSDKPRLMSLAKKLGLEASVIFEENLTDDELADRYRRCDIFCMPSGQEGFGIVFLEAMRFAKCCIGGKAGGTPEVVADGETGILVPFGDHPVLQSAIEELLGEPERRERMGAAGRQRLMDHFTFPAYQACLEKNLKRLIADDFG